MCILWGNCKKQASWHSLWQQTVFPGGKKISGCKRRIVEKQTRCNTTKTACILTHTRVFTCNRDPHTQTDKAVMRKWSGCQSAKETLRSSKVLPYECAHRRRCSCTNIDMAFMSMWLCCAGWSWRSSWRFYNIYIHTHMISNKWTQTNMIRLFLCVNKYNQFSVFIQYHHLMWLMSQ